MKSIWWNQVTNAAKYAADIKQCLLEEKSVLIKYSSALPWREQFADSVRKAVKIEDAEKKFEDVPAVENPGEYLLHEFCKKEKRAEYRPANGYAKFFAENDDIVLHDRYLWIQADSASCLEQWASFVSEYLKERGKHAKKAVFILECRESGQAPLKKGIKIFSFDDYIGEYDRIVFAFLASSSIRESLVIKNYIAELVSNVSGNDIELCCECIREYKLFLGDPFTFIRMTIAKKTRSDGARFDYDKDASEVEHLIWLSQIRTVYPKLEEYRGDFVRKYANAIAKNLPMQTPYGETSDPKDVELGMLMLMAGRGELELSKPEYEKLKCHKEARNKLSHLTALSIEEIEKLTK